jgi:hypothetical protein
LSDRLAAALDHEFTAAAAELAQLACANAVGLGIEQPVGTEYLGRFQQLVGLLSQNLVPRVTVELLSRVVPFRYPVRLAPDEYRRESQFKKVDLVVNLICGQFDIDRRITPFSDWGIVRIYYH